MSKNTTNQNHAFEIHPSVIFKLGEELITDNYQALSELVKNSYDADASDVEVIIDSENYYKIIDGSIAKCHKNEENALRGMIKIQDNGCGMSESDIINGWLTISASKKRDMKNNGLRTARGRTPLGDKGLGRLGTQRLGPILEMSTKAESEEALSVLIDWRRFQEGNQLSKILIPIQQELSFPRRKGTTLSIIGIDNPDEWQNENALQIRFADIISPYTDDMGLKVKIRVNNRKIDLREQTLKLVSNALLSYIFSYSENLFSVQGFMSTRYLTDLANSRKRALWEELIEKDHGEKFLSWLFKKKSKVLERYNVQFCPEEQDKLCTFTFSFKLEETDKAKISIADNSILDPGPFNGRIDFLPRRKTTKDPYETDISIKALLDALAGVKVYRNGFGIPVHDVIPFASQWSTGSSWYTLRPDNTVGYINITAAENAQLIETTNREAFKENGYYHNFQRLLAEWLSRAGELQETIRRGYNAYASEWESNRAEIAKGQTSTAIAADAVNILETANDVISRRSTTETEREDIQIAKRLESGKKKISVLASRIESAQEKLDDAWELAGLGIMAETIAHEAFNMIERIIHDANRIRIANSSNEQNQEIDTSVSAIITLANALRKQISHLNYSLKYVRNKKEYFSVNDLTNEVIDYLTPRFEKQGIETSVSGSNYYVCMNKGKLIQVLDNLLINSEYWLCETSRKEPSAKKGIRITLKEPYIFIEDSGIGIDPSVEETLFDPFVSRKDPKTARGLGLFISRTLLVAESCSISLCEEKNKHNRRYKFRIDLSKVVSK